MIRVLHFSDVHLDYRFDDVPISTFVGKRALGLLNLKVRRSTRFAEATNKLKALAEFMRVHQVDLALCTGDYTALGTDGELRHARKAITPFTQAPMGFVTVPGNHDMYVPKVDQESGFEEIFADLLVTDRPDLAARGVWPQVRLFGDALAIVAINSARPNPELMRSSGHIEEGELSALKEILATPEVASRFVIVATHYAPRLPNGRPDSHHHGMDNAEAFVDVCRVAERGLIAHGHVHHTYHVREPGLNLHLCGAGSATHKGREGGWVYDVGQGVAQGTPFAWAGAGYVLKADRVVQF